MKKQCKRILSMILCILLLCAAVPLQASAEIYSGSCGEWMDDVTWCLDTETGALTIQGTGSMATLYYYNSAPWYSHRSLIKTVVIENGVENITCFSFYDCPNLTDVSISDSVKNIANSAFHYCTSLTNVTIPKSVISIGKDAFYKVCNIVNNGTKTGSPWGARSVNGFVDGFLVYDSPEKQTLRACRSNVQGNVTIPNTVTNIAQSAFFRCTELTSIIIPESVTTIGAYAFEQCYGLTNVIIPDSVVQIESDAFFGVGNIVYSGLPSDKTWGAKARNKYAEGYFVFDSTEKNNLLWCSSAIRGTVVIPDSVTKIDSGIFSYHTGITSITIPNGVASIGEGTFEGCSNLVEVLIGSGVKLIEKNAFADCSSLKRVNYNGTAAEWGAIHIKEGNDSLILAERTYRPLETLTLSETKLTMHFKDTKTLTANCDVEWSSSNEKVVTVDASGKLTAVGKGKATITATDKATGDTAKCEVTVKYSFVQILIRILLFGWIWYK